MRCNHEFIKEVCVSDISKNSMLDGNIDLRQYNSCCVSVRTTGMILLTNPDRQRLSYRHSQFTIIRGCCFICSIFSNSHFITLDF
jgi:hypothetical protein